MRRFRAVVNASPLIFLAKLGRLDLLPHPCGTTPEVLEEVRAGAREGHKEALEVGKLAQEGRLVVRPAKMPSIPSEAGLHPGEASLLQLALDEHVKEVIVDDYAANRTAKLLGPRPVSTPLLMLRASRHGDMTPEEFRRLLDRLVESRYFLSAPLYQRVVELSRAGR